MKTNSLLLLASLAVFAVSARAAQNQTDSDVVVLPTYVVNASRDLSPEQLINASLDELRQQARVPMTIATEIPMLQVHFARLGNSTQGRQALRVAKS